MVRSKKFVISTLGTFSVLALALTGCSNDSSSATSNTPAPTTSSSTPSVSPTEAATTETSATETSNAKVQVADFNKTDLGPFTIPVGGMVAVWSPGDIREPSSITDPSVVAFARGENVGGVTGAFASLTGLAPGTTTVTMDGSGNGLIRTFTITVTAK